MHLGADLLRLLGTRFDEIPVVGRESLLERAGKRPRHLMVNDGEQVSAGDVLAKIPRETTKTKDITGGLGTPSRLPAWVPRLPRGVHVNVQEGDRVRAGEPLMDGPSNPHDILAVLGEKALQAYLVNEIQEVYRLQGVNINDKHIEVIVRQMMRWVKVEEVGDTEFLIEEVMDKFRFMEENERVLQEDGRPATGRPVLLGITKASLSTESFISAASFRGVPAAAAAVGCRRRRRAC